MLFSNVNLNQKVELRFKGELFQATVLYKGALTGQIGDWVGLSLNEPVGRHNGLYKGRRYFHCKNKHGVFVRASDIRMMQNTRRCLFNNYHKSGIDQPVDEELFGKQEKPRVANYNDPVYISDEYCKNNKQNHLIKTHSGYNPMRSNHLNHSISRTVPAATMTRPFTAAACYTYSSMPIHHHDEENEKWESSPSIPKTHMPLSAQRNQTKRGWENAHWIREIAYPRARESMKITNWNDISF